MDAIVSTMDAELNFAIQSSTTGRQLFDELTKAIGLRETCWTRSTETRISEKGSAASQVSSQVLPESVEDEIIQDVTLYRLFYLQIKEFVSGVIYCSAEIAVLLASYAMQVKYGDFDSNQHKPGFLDSERLLPIAVSSNIN
uniref:FERM domain-containing protein n=1 Tax=Ditylenchus dipsaci TaxID=166011 RepID=A0A915ESW1_9BILA